MKLKLGMFLIAVLLFAAPITKAFAWNSGAGCTSNQLDMLTWMAPSASYDGIENADPFGGGNGMFIVGDSSKYFMIKDAGGDSWDINYFNSSRVYSWITSPVGGTPGNAHYFYLEPPTSVPIFNRCVPNTGNGFDQSIRLQTPTGTLASCFAPGNCNYTPLLGDYEDHQIWGPFNIKLGSETSTAPTVEYANLYQCDGGWNNCQQKEIFYYQQQWGWMYWQYFKWINNAWSLQGTTDYTQFVYSSYNYIGPDGNY